MHYPTQQKKPDGTFVERKAPLLLGHTMREIPRPLVPPNPWLTGETGRAFLFFGLVIVGSALGVLWWFGRTDRRVQAEVQRQKTENNPFANESPPSGDRPLGPYLN